MPGHCICPNENYSCVVNSAIDIAWRTNTTVRDDFALSVTDDDAELHSEEGGFQVTLSRSSDLTYSITCARFQSFSPLLSMIRLTAPTGHALIYMNMMVDDV